MAAVFNAAQLTHYRPMVDDSADDLEAQLHHELYGEDSLFVVPPVEDDTHDVEGEEAHAQDDDELYDEEDYQEPAADALSVEVHGNVEHTVDVTGYEEREATLLEDGDDAEGPDAEEAAAPTKDEDETAPIADSSTLQVLASTDVYDMNTPGSLALAEEPSEPSAMLIVLPGFAEPHHLCADDEPAVLATRKDLYGKTIAELFAALRAQPILRDRFAGDWKEMTLSIPELQLILHEDDGYSSQVRLEDLAVVHMAFCNAPVKFILGEQHRFEFRFQAYQSEIQRRIEAGENLMSTEPFDPELVPLATTESVSTVADVKVIENSADKQHDMDEEEYEETEDSTGRNQAVPEGAQNGVNVDEAEYEDEYEYEEGNAMDGEQAAETHRPESTTEPVDEETYAEADDDVDGYDDDEGDEAQGGDGDEIDGGADDGAVGEEEDFAHVELLEKSVEGDVIHAVIEEPQQEETHTNGVEVEHVDYEYVDEDGNVLVEGYDSITTHERSTVEPTADIPDDSAELPDFAEALLDALAEGVDGLHKVNGTAGEADDEFEADAPLEDEYNEAEGAGDADDVLSDHLDHIDNAAPEGHPAVDAETFQHADEELDGFDENDDLEVTDDVAAAVPAINTRDGYSPTSVSGMKRPREDDIDGVGDLPAGEGTPDFSKRPRVA